MADVKGVDSPAVRDEMSVSDPSHDYSEKHDQNYAGIKDVSASSLDQYDDGLETPTEEELKTLRRVVGKVPWIAYTVGFAEFCERFSYYGTTAVCMLPPHIAPLIHQEYTNMANSRQLHSETPSTRI